MTIINNHNNNTNNGNNHTNNSNNSNTFGARFSHPRIQAAPHVRLFREHATSAPAELGGEIQHVSRNRVRTQVLPQARKLHVYGSRTFAAFGIA